MRKAKMNGFTKDPIRVLNNLMIEMEPNADYRVFWYSLYLLPVIWVVFLLLKVISFDFFYANLCLMSFLLTGANLYGYYHCDKDQAANLGKYGKNAVVNIVSKGIIGS